MNVHTLRHPRATARPGLVLLPVVVAIIFAASPATAVAHAELVSASPPAGAVVPAAPTEVALTFEGELNPDGSSFVVSTASGTIVGGGDLDLSVADRNELRGPVAISELGTYTVAWTAVSVDGHTDEGQLTFVYAAPAPGRTIPNTAAPSATEDGIGAGLGAAGVVALVAAVGTTLRARRGHRS